MIKRNDEMLFLYEDMRMSLDRLVKSIDTSEMVFWYHVIYPFRKFFETIDNPNDFSSGLACDFVGLIMITIKGNNNRCNEMYYLTGDKGVDFQKEFYLCSELAELGDRWKFLIQEEKTGSLRVLISWVELLCKEILPFVWNKFSDKDNVVWMLVDEHEVAYKVAEKIYKGYIRDLKKLNEKLRVVIEITELKRGENGHGRAF